MSYCICGNKSKRTYISPAEQQRCCGDCFHPLRAVKQPKSKITIDDDNENVYVRLDNQMIKAYSKADGYATSLARSFATQESIRLGII